MSGREVDVDALFERDADNRLLDRRRRTELGLAPPAPAPSAAPARFGAESILDDDAPAGSPRRGPLLRVALDARPDRELIPGAVVTVVATLHDDGDADALDVRVRVAIPPQAEPVAGSFARDGIAIDGDALLGEGLRLGPLAAGGATRLRLSLRIAPGTEPLDVVVHALAPGVPAVGAPTLRLHRRAGHAAYAPPRPFYELEPDEADEPNEVAEPNDADGPPDDPVAAAEPLAPPGPQPAQPPQSVQRPQPAVDALLDEPAAPPVLPRDARAEAADVPARPTAAEATDVPARPTAAEAAIAQARAAAAAPVALLVRPLLPQDVRALGRVVGGGVPDGLAALSVLTALACTGGPLGAALGLEPFRAEVAAALPRALVAARMRKPTPPVVSAHALAALAADAPAPPAAPAPDGPALVVALDAADLAALRAALSGDADDPFLRGAQVLLAVAPRALAGADHAAAARAGDVLAAYRVAAGAWLMRVSVRRAVDRRYDPLIADDVALRDAGAALVTVLREVCA